jgi:hypothetical protein
MISSLFLVQFLEPIHLPSVWCFYFLKELGDFKLFIFLKEVSMLAFEVQVYSRVCCKDLIAEARVQPSGAVADALGAYLK